MKKTICDDHLRKNCRVFHCLQSVKKLKIGDTVTVRLTGKIHGHSTLYPYGFLVSTPFGIFVVKPSQLERVK